MKDIEVTFDPEKREYVIKSEGNFLRLDEKQFRAIKTGMNGIAYALMLKDGKVR